MGYGVSTSAEEDERGLNEGRSCSRPATPLLSSLNTRPGDLDTYSTSILVSIWSLVLGLVDTRLTVPRIEWEAAYEALDGPGCLVRYGMRARAEAEGRSRDRLEQAGPYRRTG